MHTPARSEIPDRPDRPDRPARPESPIRPDRPERPGGGGQGGGNSGSGGNAGNGHHPKDGHGHGKRNEYWDDRNEFYEDRRDFVLGATLSASTFSTMSCTSTTVVVGGVTYYECGTAWYNRRYAGGHVTYVVVSAPAGY